VELFFEVQQPVSFALGELRDRDARAAGHDLRDVVRAHLRRVRQGCSGGGQLRDRLGESFAVLLFQPADPVLELLATQRAAVALGRHHVVWHLAWALNPFHRDRGYRRDALAAWRAALNAAAHLPAPTIPSRTHRHLGRARSLLELHEEATGHLDTALALASRHSATERTTIGRWWTVTTGNIDTSTSASRPGSPEEQGSGSVLASTWPNGPARLD
jgi:hypothetical protein